MPFVPSCAVRIRHGRAVLLSAELLQTELDFDLNAEWEWSLLTPSPAGTVTLWQILLDGTLTGQRTELLAGRPAPALPYLNLQHTYAQARNSHAVGTVAEPHTLLLVLFSFLAFSFRRVLRPIEDTEETKKEEGTARSPTVCVCPLFKTR